MNKKYFPIRTQTACQLKWNWSTLYLYGGKTASCHRTSWSRLDSDNFNAFHNTPQKLLDRAAMLDNKWPEDSCRYCKKIEDVGGFSDRMLHLDVPDMSPGELEENPTAINISPTILEVFFNNTCNLSCLYCLPELSSKINAENLKFGHFDSHGVVLKSEQIDEHYDSMVNMFWDWMKNNSQKLKRFNVLGGEPFYQSEFYRLLDFFESNPHPELELGIVTNLMVSSEKLDQLIFKFNNLLSKRSLKRIDITCSIDCWGAEQEYVRYGLDLNTWRENFDLMTKLKWITLNINQTLSVLTIQTMPELLEQVNRWREFRKIGHYFSTVSPQPSYLMVDILGPDIFQQSFKKIFQLMPTETKTQQTALAYMTGIYSLVKSSSFDYLEVKKLYIFLEEKDRRRGTEWKKVFPWLIPEFEKCGIVV